MLEVRYPNVEVRITEEYPWGYDGEDDEFYSVENPDAAGILERVRSALREGGGRRRGDRGVHDGGHFALLQPPAAHDDDVGADTLGRPWLRDDALRVFFVLALTA